MPEPAGGSVLAAAGPEGRRSLFRMRAGMIEPLDDASGAEEALAAIRAVYRRSGGTGIDRTAVFHAGVPTLAARLSELLGGVDFVTGFSVAMQVHTGRGVVGAAWIAGDGGR